MSVNVNLVGRLGRDAEIVNGKNGQFLSFSVATDEYRNKQRETVWFNVMYNNLNLAQWLKKGKLVNINGTETVRLYQSKNGQTQIDRTINAGFVEFVSVGSGQTQNGEATVSNETETQAKAPLTTGTLKAPQAAVKTTINVNPPTSSEIAKEEVDDDDLPF